MLLVSIRNAPVLCFLALTGISIRDGVLIRNSGFAKIAGCARRSPDPFERHLVALSLPSSGQAGQESWRLIFGRGLCFERLTRDSINSGWRLILPSRGTEAGRQGRTENCVWKIASRAGQKACAGEAAQNVETHVFWFTQAFRPGLAECRADGAGFVGTASGEVRELRPGTASRETRGRPFGYRVERAPGLCFL